MAAITKIKSVKKRFNHLSLSNPVQLIITAKKGVRATVFYEFAEAIQMPENNLAAILNITARTVSNYHGKQKVLNPVQSEHLLKLIGLYEKGEEIFGNLDEFTYWLQKPLWNENQKPVDWLITPGGVDLIKLELDRLAHSYPV